jgi:hypothetical protein
MAIFKCQNCRLVKRAIVHLNFVLVHSKPAYAHTPPASIHIVNDGVPLVECTTLAILSGQSDSEVAVIEAELGASLNSLLRLIL